VHWCWLVQSGCPNVGGGGMLFEGIPPLPVLSGSSPTSSQHLTTPPKEPIEASMR